MRPRPSLIGFTKLRAFARIRNGIAKIRTGFAEDRSGVAAVEFALLLPVMMVMYLGVVEISRAITNSRKVAQLARTLADLTSRDVLTNASMDDILASRIAVLAPFDAGGVRIVVSSIGVYGSGGSVIGKVCSSKASGKDASNNSIVPLPLNKVVDVPAGYETAGLRFVRADVDMDYTPLLGVSILQWVTTRTSISFSEQAPWPVRAKPDPGKTTFNSTYPEVVMPGGSPCA